MNALRTYLRTLTPEKQREYAARCGTSIGYLRNLLSLKPPPRVDGLLCRRLEEESEGAVPRESLRPDIWPERVSAGGAQ
jgi:hypothetical protein